MITLLLILGGVCWLLALVGYLSARVPTFLDWLMDTVFL